MAKKNKQKKARCPTCKTKLIKVRNKDERYCLECGYLEPILQAPGDSIPQPIPTDQEPEKELTEHPEPFDDDVAKVTNVTFADIILVDDEPPILSPLAAQQLEAQQMQNFYNNLADRPLVDVVEKARLRQEAEHIQRIKAKRPNGAVVSKGLLALPKVTVYCWSRGQIRGYAYGTNCPYPNPVWRKEMSGSEAYRFLMKVKRSNRNQKLETGTIIEYSEPD